MYKYKYDTIQHDSYIQQVKENLLLFYRILAVLSVMEEHGAFWAYDMSTVVRGAMFPQFPVPYSIYLRIVTWVHGSLHSTDGHYVCATVRLVQVGKWWTVVLRICIIKICIRSYGCRNFETGEVRNSKEDKRPDVSYVSTPTFYLTLALSIKKKKGVRGNKV